MLSLIVLPTPATALTDIGAWSSPFFTELLPVAMMIAGIIIGVFFVAYLGRVIVKAVKGIGGSKKRGRR